MPTSLYESTRENPAGYRDATIDDLVRHRCEARIIDVREPSEYNGELGHIAGSELVPLATLEAEAASWDPSTEILLVCRSGARSGRAATALVHRGFTAVMNLVGGMLAYNQRDLPVERDPALRRPRIAEVRDEVYACFVGMAADGGAPDDAIRATFHDMFADCGASFERPTRDGMSTVLDRLHQAAVAMGRDAKVVDSHLRHYRDLVAVSVE